MSKTFYKRASSPKLLAEFTSHHHHHHHPASRISSTSSKNNNKSFPPNKSIQVWNTTCIVTNFGKDQSLTQCSILINPANPELSGVSQFPYFPRGGPVPKDIPKSMHKDWQPLGYTSSWGGMDVGTGMLYPASVVDGIVHQLGGQQLAAQCKLIHLLRGGCPVGTAVSTSMGGKRLRTAYDSVIHTTPPFYNQEGQEEQEQIDLLGRCYRKSLDLAFQQSSSSAINGDGSSSIRIACPLLGAGARGFPLNVAITTAALECWKWMNNSNRGQNQERERDQVLAFGIPDKSIADMLVGSFEECAEG